MTSTAVIPEAHWSSCLIMIHCWMSTLKTSRKGTRLTDHLSSDIQNELTEKNCKGKGGGCLLFSHLCRYAGPVPYWARCRDLQQRNRWLLDHWMLSWIQGQKDQKWDSRDDWKCASWPGEHGRLQRAGTWQRGKHVRESQTQILKKIIIFTSCLPHRLYTLVSAIKEKTGCSLLRLSDTCWDWRC